MQQDKEALEKVQRRAVGMVTNLRRGTYEDKLAEAGMLSLEDRRERGDMISAFKILSGLDKVEPGLIFGLDGEGPGPRTRQAAGTHRIKKQRTQPKSDIRRHSFSQRVVTSWNTLPDSLKEVQTVLAFKIGYDDWVRGGRLGARNPGH